MRNNAIPFQFEIAEVLKDLARSADARPSAVQLSLPFISVLVHPSIMERDVAAEIVVRAGDRRVLSAQECCDGCIDDALRSLQELRAQLVSKRVELIGERDGSLYQLIELMLIAIRQFLTFQQQLSSRYRGRASETGERFRSPEDRQTYFYALELLRGHLSRCLGQIAIIAGICVPSDGLIAGYQGAWPMDAYKLVDVSK
ncbi:MAG TPA: hypothetical protein VGE72_31485 [Azospirillum sp.]